MLKILVSNILLMGILVVLADEVKAQKKESQGMISIGLLVNEFNEKQAIHAAHKVIDRINESGGVQGKELKLETRLVKGAWGAGSSQIVDLVFKDKVVGIIGALDGRNAHLAEQVIAKTQIVYVSAWASDPTLSKAYVSWYFSVVPTDDQQARVLIKAIQLENHSNTRILLVHDDSYDANQSLKSFRSSIAESQNISIQTLKIAASDDEGEWLPKILDSEKDVVVALGRSLPISEINKALQRNQIKPPLLYLNIDATGSSDFETLRLMKPQNIRCISKSSVENSKNSDYPVGVDGYIQDGMMALIHSLQDSEGDFSDVQEVMSGINFQGVTGQIEFDELGRLKGAENRLKMTTPFQILNKI